MKNKYFLIIILFFTEACGIGFFGIGTENNIYKNSADIKFKKNTCMPLGFLSFGCTQYLKEKNEENKNYVREKIDEIYISLYTLSSSKIKIISFGLLPLIPAPPIIPTFFFPAMGHEEFCGGESYKIKLIFESEFNILDNIVIDLKSIYLLKDNKKIYANDYTNELKTHKNAITKKIDSYKKIFIINFPITCKETNNSLIFVNNIKIDNRNVNLPVGKIMYNSSWGFMMGYFINN